MHHNDGEPARPIVAPSPLPSTTSTTAPGATITAIEPVDAEPAMRRLRADRATLATLPATEIRALGLAVGDRWTEQVAHVVQKAVRRSVAREAAMKMLSRRAFSRGELIEQLVRKGHDDETARDVAQRLAASGLIDDESCARSIARATLAAEPASQEFLRRKLEARRIPSEVAQRVAREAVATSDPVQAAVRFASRRLRNGPAGDRSAAARRIAHALARRGFDSDIIAEALKRLDLVGGDPLDLGGPEAAGGETEW
ncbi:MAG: regulatory protein RecX [Planctomycetota bacterium]|jgi:regulatory protein